MGVYICKFCNKQVSKIEFKDKDEKVICVECKRQIDKEFDELRVEEVAKGTKQQHKRKE